MSIRRVLPRCLVLMGVLFCLVTSLKAKAADPQELKFDQNRLWPREERLAMLSRFAITPAAIQATIYYDAGSEPEMIAVAQNFLKEHRSHMPAKAQAMLWEELTWTIDYRQDYDEYRVSRGYRWTRPDGLYYVFQGPLAFENDEHYTLVIAPDGSDFNGLASKIGDDISQWRQDPRALGPL